MGQNKTKSQVSRPKATTRAEGNFISVTILHYRGMSAPNITEQLKRFREKICQHLL